MADGTQTTNGVANAGAPVPAPAPAPAPAAAPAPPADGTLANGQIDVFAETREAMNDGNSENFLADFLADAGLPIDSAPPIGAPTAPTPPAPPAPPVGNAVPPAPNTGQQPTAPTVPVPGMPVDPALVQRLFQPTAPQYPGQPPVAPWPQQPQQPTMAPQGQQQQPQPNTQQPNAPEAIPMPFEQPFQIPEEVAQAMDHEDPRARRAAIGAIIAAAGNQTFKKVVEYVQQNIAPSVANATFAQVQRRDFEQTVERELFGPAPQLRYASPMLIQQAANVIVQDELSRNPAAAQQPPTPQMWERIRSLALQGLANIQAGQPQPMPQMQQQMPQGYPPPPMPVPPAAPTGYVFSPQHGGYIPVQPAPMPVYPQPHVPFVAGQHGAPMGVPQFQQPTPESEVQSFLNGGWG